MPGLNVLFVGACNIDTVLLTGAPLPVGGGKFKVKQTAQEFGGGGLNASVACARLSEIFDNKVNVTLATKLGSGTNARQAGHFLQDNGVEVLDVLLRDPQADIPNNIVISGTDDRQIHVTPHSYPAMPAKSIDTLMRAVYDAKIVHIHTRAGDLAVKAAEIAKNAGKPIIVDASGYDTYLDKVMAFATHAALPDELIFADNQTGPEAVMNYIMSFENIRHAAVMCGDKPTHINLGRAFTMTMPVQVTDKFAVQDKLGAGDAARGAMVLNMAADPLACFPAALRHAHRIGTFSCAFIDREWLGALEQNPAVIDEYVGNIPHEEIQRFQEIYASLG